MTLPWNNYGLQSPLGVAEEKNPKSFEKESDSAQKKILIVEDESDIAELIMMYCQKEGYSVISATDGESGLEYFERELPDLVLLDLMLPGMGGLEVCRRIHSISEVPIIVITARREEVDKLLALETGADDYITKPFSPRELMARIRLILRRIERSLYHRSSRNEKKSAAFENKPLIVGKLTIKLYSREVNYDQQPITNLTKVEYDLLVHLAQYPGRVYSATELEEAIFGYEHPSESRVISVHISNLRNKLLNPELIVTVYGTGYKLQREPE
jgi:two-component system response regulator MtrA